MDRCIYKYGIVVIGYKNKKGIERLLGALAQAHYQQNNILLIISIDYSGNNDVYDLAREYEWKFGKKEIVQYDKNLGLREHVIRCGDYLNIFDLDSLVVFEDDMFPSEDFFQYSKAATEKYFYNENIAGISLYNREINQTVMKTFAPMYICGDNYFFQYAQSRGQVWFRNRWNDFRNWYEKHKGDGFDEELLPIDVINWPDTSWLKYHIRYCVENEKYFVYPYISHSTCFGEVGEHLKMQTDKWQVCLSLSTDTKYEFVDFNEDSVRYDVFYENENLYRILGIDKRDLTVDLYGGRTVCTTRYLLTIREVEFPILKTWGKRLKPHELNIIYNIEGNDIYLYDMGEAHGTIGIKTGKAKGKYILYGAGNTGISVMRHLGKENILCFCDCNKSGDVIDGIPVVDIDDLDKYIGMAVIVVSVLNPRFIMEITQILERKGLKAIYWQDVVKDVI